MSSHRRSARAKQRAAFEEQLDPAGFGDLFERERVRNERDRAAAEAARRRRACESKQRYRSRKEAQDAVAACAAHGQTGLSIYRCPYCNGWHLTSHPRSSQPGPSS